jgi:hypothetical protein
MERVLLLVVGQVVVMPLLLRLHHIVVVVPHGCRLAHYESLLTFRRWIPNINEPFIREIRKEQSNNSLLVQLFIANHKLVTRISAPFPWTDGFESQQSRRII